MFTIKLYSHGFSIQHWGGVKGVWHQFSLDHLSTASNWIGVQTSVFGFDSRSPHKPVVENRNQQLFQRKGACFLLNKKEALSGLIQVNDDEERNGGQAGRVYGCQL